MSQLCNMLLNTMLPKTNITHYHKYTAQFQSSFLTRRYSNLSPPKHFQLNEKQSIKFLVYCNSLITKHGNNGNIEESESIFNRMPHKNAITHTSLLTAYAKNGQISKARKLFDEMPERTVATYNAMITAYTKNNFMVDEAFSLFSSMNDKNEVSYGAMITGFLRAGMFEKAEILCREMPVKWREPGCSNAMISGYLKVGRLEEAIRVFEGMVEKDVVSWSCMVDGYCKKGRVSEARELFDRMPMRNVVTWTAMIDGYMNVEYFEEGFELFLSMRRGDVAVNPLTLTIMFEACRRFGVYREGIQIHGLAMRMGFEFDIFLGNSIIAMYCRFGCVDEANRVFQMMNTKDVVSWNSLIAGYVQNDKFEEAYELFEILPGKDVVSWTTMITGYSAKGNVQKAIELFQTMPKKDSIAWTAVIYGFISNGEYEEAFHWFIDMLRQAVKPNSLTFSSMLSASASLASLNEGLQIHAHVQKIDMQFDLSIQNSLVSMYSKCGNVSEAYRVFASINAPNVISFNSMITGFSQNGYGEQALNLFSKMQKDRQKPNDITFLGILSACTHVGLVKKGWEYFDLMKSVYNIEPGLDHYACMVDLLGRAGFLNDAINLIDSMPFEPHSGVWGALLGASRIHSRLDLANLAAQHLTKLEPDNATAYVVLSGIYNSVGKEKDGDRIRMMKKSKGLKKSPGCSWIILNNKVHLFLAGDKSHMDLEEIKGTLFILTKEMNGLDFYEN
ncbi:pentatricopeptide repeat-containing protein At1g53600, mitochondrial [Mercurialis annua]|uniref:pentatricopeptide repeat-containing protein At1g53600, mitochondrial n=1 Tax=Mercurialis annua TaxID=3986 RepID=UPI0021604DB2|nr:pentatricopeptide repeat-containing protein At1g53600, mitochondrial [Mercurialis annua]